MSNMPVLLFAILWLCGWAAFISLLPKHEEEIIRVLAFLGSLSFFWLCCIMLYHFDCSEENFQYAFELPIIREYDLSLSFGLDGISFCFLLLTAFIMPLCIFGSYTLEGENKRLIVYLFLLEIFLVMSFCTTNLFFFFVFFESVLIPMFLIIGVWGARSRKINAAYYFFLYTLFGSFFLLFGILYLYTLIGSFEYEVLLNIALSSKEQIFLFLFFFIPFAIKIPMFPFHLWLPEAHVEAPTIGSVILASLLLKLGGYGFLRFTISMLPVGCTSFQALIIIWGIISLIYASLAAFRQNDLKRIIAYSSIAHMNLIVLGLFSFTHQGIDGAIYLMIGHGIVSAGLFFCVGELYDRYHTRSMKHYSGLAQIKPLFGIFFFLFTMANMSFPGTSNFIGELLILVGLFENNSWVMVFSATGTILSAIYSIWLFNRIFFGTLKIESENISQYSDLNRASFYIFLVLASAMVLLGIYSGTMTDLTNMPIKKILVAFETKG